VHSQAIAQAVVDKLSDIGIATLPAIDHDWDNTLLKWSESLGCHALRAWMIVGSLARVDFQRRHPSCDRFPTHSHRSWHRRRVAN
jgi:hypothetical protein